MNNPQNQPIRSLLYYPTIHIPSGQWLKQAVLYWDEVGSIVPRDNEGKWLLRLSPDLKYLAGEEIFHPHDPQLLEQTWDVSEKFLAELRRIIDSNLFYKRLAPENRRSYDSKIHWNKVSSLALHFLMDRGLARISSDLSEKFFMSNAIFVPENEKWVYFERQTALLYMSLMAKYMACTDSRDHVLATPATDRADYQFLSFAGDPVLDKIVGVEIKMQHWLPQPDPHVPMPEIVAFKRKRQDELLGLQSLMSDFEQQLSKAESTEEAKQIAYKFEIDKQKGLHDLEASLKDAKIETSWGSLNTLLGVSAPPLIGFLAGKIAEATQVSDPVVSSIVAFGLSASVALKAYYVAHQSAVNEKFRNSPYSYLFHAQRASIISG